MKPKWIGIGMVICIVTFLSLYWMEKKDESSATVQELPIHYFKEEPYIPLQSMINYLQGSFHYDKVNRQLTMRVDHNSYELTEKIPVVVKNGEYIPFQRDNILYQNHQVYVPIDFMETVLNREVTLRADHAEVVPSALATSIDSVTAKKEMITINEVKSKFSELSTPIHGAKADTYSSHLPGARRWYRNDFHEGLDWYGYSSGITISKKTPVYAMGDGKVVRVDHDYKGYTSEMQREADLAICQTIGHTPQYILDKLRGRQVWIQYENGVQARFAHLSTVSNSLQVGDEVSNKTLIGLVGNSGTSGEVKQDQSETHLHVDLLVYNHLFWKGLTQEQVKEVITTAFK
ncbi:M23 family metallopeptidase [Priestia koreensis]|nr:M23 family metallopeptidase [Priestia koreensis]